MDRNQYDENYDQEYFQLDIHIDQIFHKRNTFFNIKKKICLRNKLTSIVKVDIKHCSF